MLKYLNIALLFCYKLDIVTFDVQKLIHSRDARPAPPRPGPGGNGCPGPPRPRKFSTLPRPAPPHPGKRGRCPAPPRPENYPGARIGANVPTSSKVFGSQKLLTSIFSTKGALRRHVTYNNHPNLT